MNAQIDCIDQIFFRKRISLDARADIWCLHGFAESSLSFKEAFTWIDPAYNVFAVDAPGFGVSPINMNALRIQDTTKLYQNLIEKVSGPRPIIILAHSLGGLSGTWLAKSLKNVRFFFNIEGNLTAEDCFFSGKANQFESPDEFFIFFRSEVFKILKNDPALHRYYASIQYAHPSTLLAWGKSGSLATGHTKAGEEYANVDVKKIYFYGEKSISPQTKKFLTERKIESYEFKNSGHWPMIDCSEELYSFVNRYLQEVL